MTTSKANKIVMYTPVIIDIALLICLFIWLGIVVHPYQSNLSHCKKLADDKTCFTASDCHDDDNCGVSNGPECDTDYNGCMNMEQDGCKCIPRFEISGLMFLYVITFSLAMINDILKGLIVIAFAINNQCWCCEDSSAILNRSCCCDSKKDPAESTCLALVVDSWALLCLRVANPKRYEELMIANEEGRLRVWTGIRLAEIITRDIFVTVSIYVGYQSRYHNPLLFVYVALIFIQWVCLRRRTEYERAIQARKAVQQPGVVLQVQAQPQAQPQPMYVPQQATIANGEQPMIIYQQGPIPQPIYTNQVPNQVTNQIANQQMVLSNANGEGK